MNLAYEILYKELLEEIGKNQETDLPEVERATICFWIAHAYWDKLKEMIRLSPYKNQSEEIQLFRNVKPQFTGYIQYFTILSEALLFIPDKKEYQADYWQEEMRRYDFFCYKHPEFVDYFKSERHDLDDQYFRKAADDWQPVHPLMTYDSDKNFCSTHDWLVRGLVAHTMYYEYAKKRRLAACLQ